MTTTKKKTEFQKLQAAKTAHCKGKKTTAEVKAIAKKYVEHAVSKGKNKAEAEKSAKRVLEKPCTVKVTIKSSTKPKISGTRKRKTTK
jgi:hypothetical protein